MAFQEVHLAKSNPEQKLIETLSGFRHRIQAYLERNGWIVKVNRLVSKKFIPQLDRFTPGDLTALDERQQIDAIGLICDHDEGFIIKAPTGWGKTYLICQLCKILPETRIAIVVPGQTILKSVYNRLLEHIRDVGMVGAGSNQISRVTLSTMESVDKLQGIEWDLLLFDECHRAAAPVTANNLAAVFPMAKCIGLSASPFGRSDGADPITEAIFGPVLYTVSYQEAVQQGSVVPIRVNVYRIDVGPNLIGVKGTNLNKLGLWRNDRRNQFIAKIAKQVPEDEQVLITVATAEHALYLRQYLTNFEVVFSNITGKGALRDLHQGKLAPVNGLVGTTMLDEHRDHLRREFEAGRLKRVIATGVWATGVDFVKLRWLIRADGMASEIQATQTPGRLSRIDPEKDYGILVDFADNFNQSLFGRSTKRIRSYMKKGWTVDYFEDPEVTIPTFRRIIAGAKWKMT